MSRALQATGLVLSALMLWASCTMGALNSPQPALSFTVQNFTSVAMTFQVVVNEDLSTVQVFTLNGGGNQLITLNNTCPATVRFTGIRFGDQLAAPDINFYAGTVTSVSQGVFPGQVLTTTQATTQAASFPTFVCPAAFQINAFPGQITVALANRTVIGGAPVTPTQAFQFITITPTILPR